ncbi:MAG: hypothetical protein BWZ10_02510 [candidate division BRC1 bacterium ADurb.BinA364]|nr:MAG: hypothetical protein BWZ10_02510 [candidate division BRC1 bacterium ADurb.BinA364]
MLLAEKFGIGLPAVYGETGIGVESLDAMPRFGQFLRKQHIAEKNRRDALIQKMIGALVDGVGEKIRRRHAFGGAEFGHGIDRHLVIGDQEIPRLAIAIQRQHLVDDVLDQGFLRRAAIRKSKAMIDDAFFPLRPFGHQPWILPGQFADDMRLLADDMDGDDRLHA